MRTSHLILCQTVKKAESRDEDDTEDEMSKSDNENDSNSNVGPMDFVYTNIIYGHIM